MRNSVSFGAIILRIALAFLLIVTGIWGITGGNTLFGGIAAMFSGITKTIIITIISVAALVAGFLLIIGLFAGNFPIVDVILLIFTILWLIQLVLSVIGSLNTAFSSTASMLNFLYGLANNFLILAALIISQKKFS